MVRPNESDNEELIVSHIVSILVHKITFDFDDISRRYWQLRNQFFDNTCNIGSKEFIGIMYMISESDDIWIRYYLNHGWYIFN